nr:translation initiation factor IF-2-like [Symphalangus syndactylus]
MSSKPMPPSCLLQNWHLSGSHGSSSECVGAYFAGHQVLGTEPTEGITHCLGQPRYSPSPPRGAAPPSAPVPTAGRGTPGSSRRAARTGRPAPVGEESGERRRTRRERGKTLPCSSHSPWRLKANASAPAVWSQAHYGMLQGGGAEGGRGRGAREGLSARSVNESAAGTGRAPQGAPGSRRGRQGFLCGGLELPGGSRAAAPEPVPGNGSALPVPAPVRPGQAQRPSSARPPARTLGPVAGFLAAAPHSALADPGWRPRGVGGTRLGSPGGRSRRPERVRRPSRSAGTPEAAGRGLADAQALP